MNIDADNEELFGHVFGQFLLHEGLRKFGDKGEDAAFGEKKQLHDRMSFRPRFVHDLTKDDKDKALDMILLIEEKKDGRIKGRGVANGSKQRGSISKEEAASPTVSLESILLTSIIDAKEN